MVKKKKKADISMRSNSYFAAWVIAGPAHPSVCIPGIHEIERAAAARPSIEQSSQEWQDSD